MRTMKPYRMTGKIISMALAAVLAVAFAGGGNSGTAATTGSAAASEESTAATTGSAAASEESTAASSAADSTTSTSGGSVDGSMKGVKLKVGTSGLFGPFTYYDSDGKTLIGYDLDLLQKLEDKLGFEVDGSVQAMSYSALTASVSQGKLDMAMAALCATDERKKTMDFSDIYCDSGQKVMINKTNPEGIKSVDDLHGKKVAVEKGTASHLYAQKNLTDATLEVHDTITTAYASLEQGKVDAVIQDGPGCAFYLKTNPNSKLEIVGDEFNQGQAPYAIAFKRGFQYESQFNAALKELKDDGTLDSLYKKWCS